MRGVKPFKLSFMTRPFQWGREYRMGVGVLAYVDLQTGALCTDMEMWATLPEVLGKDAAVDAGMPKSRAEFLVTASAYQPGGVPGAARRVRVVVGETEKVVYVVGDREWKKGVPTPPVPFTSMPITWENAFGGEGYDKNPRGKGFAPVVGDDGEERRPLPNIELPGQMINDPKDRPPPACFGPVDFTWHERFSRAGTYDQRWFETRYPGFAEDMDWRIWNAAPADQQQEQPFRGGERIVIEHMHPTKPLIEARVPELRARAFVRLKKGDVLEEMTEVQLRFTTIWLFPALMRAVLVWHGAQRCREDDGSDVDVLMVAAETPARPRTFEHYRDVMERRIGPERGLEVLNDDDLVPPGEAGMGGEIEKHIELLTPENLAAARRRAEADVEVEKTRARLVALGLDPDEHGPKPLPPVEPPPDLSKMPELQASLVARAMELKEQAEKGLAAAEEKAKKFYDEVGLDFGEVQAEMSVSHMRGPPTFTADSERARMRALAEEATASGMPLGELEHYATDEDKYVLWKQIELQLLQAYRGGAHHQPPADALSTEESAPRRKAVQDHAQRRVSMAGWNLTGADLSGLDLTGADLIGALMEMTDLTGTRLADARLDGVVLAHAKLERTVLDGASLAGANLGKASLVDASFARADLRGAVLDGVKIERTSFAGALLSRPTFHSAHLAGVDFRGADLTQATFVKTTLEAASFAGAQLKQAHFIQMDLSAQDFSGAQMEEVTFMESVAPRAVFAGAHMVGVRFVPGGSLAGANLRGANLERANLRGVLAGNADLTGARLDGADLTDADLRGSRMSGVRARRALMVRTNLSGAFARGADLFEAMLKSADLRGTDLRDANLYAADFALIRGDAETKIDRAITDRLRARPRREEEA